MTDLEKTVGELGKYIKEKYPNDKQLWILFTTVNVVSTHTLLMLQEKEAEVTNLIKFYGEQKNG